MEFEHVSPIFWKGIADKKYFAISLALDMFHDILEEIIQSLGAMLETMDLLDSFLVIKLLCLMNLSEAVTYHWSVYTSWSSGTD